MHEPSHRASRALRRLGAKLSGRYTLVRLIGIGGMATVYEATHRDGRPFAVKILHDSLSSDPHAERLFQREARLANTIGHPGVVPVVDHGVGDDGCAFLVMPLLRGETLSARAARAGGKLPPDEAFVVGHTVLEALAQAHRSKIVHRDLKPANLFVTREGEVRVLDFGIARFFDAEGAATATASGLVLGTPAFMAPEQALGRTRQVDARTDLWGLGATLFTLLAGRFVHDAEGAGELAVMAATKPAPGLADVAPHVPRALCDVIDRALSFDRDARWSDAGAMDAALLAAFGKPVAELPKLQPLQGEAGDERATAPTRAPGESLDPPSSDRSAFVFTDRGSVALAKRGRGRLVLTLAATTCALAAAALPVARGWVPFTRASAAPAAASSPSNDLAAPGASPVADDALVDYRAGLQLWRDASLADAAEKLDAAATKAPAFAAAHLWFVLATAYATPKSRGHYASAVTYRSALTPTQSALLEAYGPAMSDPPDYATTARELARAAERFPESVELPIARARLLIRMGDVAGAQATLATIRGPASSLGVVLLHRALLASYDSDPEPALALFRECVHGSPTATTCLELLWQLSEAEGRCGELEPVCRTFTSRQPASPLGYECLADAVLSTGGTPAEARAADEEAYEHMDPSDVALARAQNDVWLTVVEGRPDDAVAKAKTWVDLAASEGASPSERAASYEAYVALNLEVGRRETAAQAAREFVTKARSWPRTSTIDLDATGISLRSEVGDLDEAQRRPLRARVIASTEDASYGPPFRRWCNGYAATSWTADEARDAVAHLPSPLKPTQASGDDFLFGRVFALAGDSERAERFFGRAARSCSVGDDFYRTKAKLEEATLAESPAQACPLYADVVAHWGSSPKSTTAASAERRARDLHCPQANETKGTKEEKRP